MRHLQFLSYLLQCIKASSRSVLHRPFTPTDFITPSPHRRLHSFICVCTGCSSGNSGNQKCDVLVQILLWLRDSVRATCWSMKGDILENNWSEQYEIKMVLLHTYRLKHKRVKLQGSQEWSVYKLLSAALQLKVTSPTSHGSQCQSDFLVICECGPLGPLPCKLNFNQTF